jgi:hypothetical protein
MAFIPHWHRGWIAVVTGMMCLSSAARMLNHLGSFCSSLALEY